MKFLHSSDWHLGAMDGERYLTCDQQFFIDEICKIIEENDVDAVIVAGDIYDRSVASAEAVRLYDYATTKICLDLKKPLIEIAGNHDSAQRLSVCRNLLGTSGLHILGSLEKEPCIVSFDDTDVYLLPWITQEKVRSIFPEKKDEIESLEDAYKAVTDSMKATFNPDKRHFIVSHAFITNSETSTSDRAAEIGFATQVSASVFDGFDYVALGHLHKPQNVTDTVRYSGTPMPYSFGKEEAHQKSVTIIDTETMEQTIVTLPLLHCRTTLDGTLEELLNPEYDEKIINGYVRLRVSDSYIGLEALSQLKKIYPNLLEVSGKSFEKENSSVTMSMEQFEELESNPAEVFKFFCGEEMGIAPDEHLLELFENAVTKVSQEAD